MRCPFATDVAIHLRSCHSSCSAQPEPAVRQARAAAGAVILPDDRLVPAAELVAFLDPRRKDQVQVRRVHVAVGDDRPVGQHGKRRGQAGLARPALAADDDQFLHAHYPLLPTSDRSFEAWHAVEGPSADDDRSFTFPAADQRFEALERFGHMDAKTARDILGGARTPAEQRQDVRIPCFGEG